VNYRRLLLPKHICLCSIIQAFAYGNGYNHPTCLDLLIDIELKMIVFGSKQPSRYLRTTWMLKAEAILTLPDYSRIHFLEREEVLKLSNLVRKRNVFARHSRENNFYLQRIEVLSDRTVIEVIRPGTPNEMIEEAERVAELLEKVVVLSTTLAMKKNAFQHKLGIKSKPREVIDFVIGPEFRYLRSRSQSEPQVTGLNLNEQFRKRFNACGFLALYEQCLTRGDLANRMSSSVDWLFESRTEPKLTASVVKTAIALETLLILQESESLARSLSERVAFILSSNPEVREKLSRIIKNFYDARSGVVHGSKNKLKNLSPGLLESVDRLCLLLLLVLAANTKVWSSTEGLRLWCEQQRWGSPTTDIKIPFAPSYLAN